MCSVGALEEAKAAIGDDLYTEQSERIAQQSSRQKYDTLMSRLFAVLDNKYPYALPQENGFDMLCLKKSSRLCQPRSVRIQYGKGLGHGFPGCTEWQLQYAENLFGFKLPLEFRAMYKAANGVHLPFWSVMPLHQIVSEFFYCTSVTKFYQKATVIPTVNLVEGGRRGEAMRVLNCHIEDPEDAGVLSQFDVEFFFTSEYNDVANWHAHVSPWQALQRWVEALESGILDGVAPTEVYDVKIEDLESKPLKTTEVAADYVWDCFVELSKD
eukprot:TRINITY_DN9704_c0_g1_i2.p1 TRINITY_DN9704_c0_g1~~TRINITY_DN9704_c0_g1_i2.p1  ORF type:complete len:269 (-),score=53.45 TRINITY_DN9704_c0_g1_i2:243-1049(-)